VKQEFCFGLIYFFVYHVAQAVRCWFFTVEPRVQSWVTLYEIRSGTGAGFSPSLGFYMLSIISPLPYTCQSPKTCDCLGLDLAGFGVRMCRILILLEPVHVVVTYTDHVRTSVLAAYYARREQTVHYTDSSTNWIPAYIKSINVKASPK
jgi:hypothetical protein